MYTVSVGYKQAIKSGFLRSRVEITITPKAGEAFHVSDADILPGSLSINNRATASNDFGYGSVYVGQMKVTLIDVAGAIDRYSLFDAACEVTFVQVLSDVQEERIPMGTYYVSTPTRKNKTVVLDCYDVMTKFDRNLTEATFGTPFELLSYLCTYVGVTLGMTQEEIEAMPNGTTQFTFANYQNMTARDALSGIAKMLCGFATIDRSGELVIRQFATTQCDSISARNRTSSTIADYKTYFVAVTAKMVVDGEAKSVTALTGREDGLILDLGNVFIAQGVESLMKQVLQTVADVLAGVDFTPVTCEIVPDPSYDLGDMIQLTGVNNTFTNVLTLLSSYTWKYHGKMKITGDGRNALLNAVKSSEAKMIDDVASTISDNAYAVKTYTNASQLNIGGTDTIIITLNYSVNKDTTTAFLATIPIYMALDGEVIFGYHLNTDPVEEIKVYLERGWHAVTLTNYFANDSQSQNRLTVTCRTAYFESDKRIQDSQISGLIDAVSTGEYAPAEIDTTIPGATIPITSIKAIIFASGINTRDSWDGTLLLVEEIGAVALGNSGITVKPITDLPLVATSNNSDSAEFTEQIAAITLGNSAITIRQIAEAINMGRKVLFLTIDTSHAIEYAYSRRFVTIVNNGFTMNEEYPSPSQYVAVDDGALKQCDCDVTGLTPRSMTIVATGERENTGTSLPGAYQQVEYIENTTASTIVTSFVPTYQSRIVVDAQEVTSNNYPRIFANGAYSGQGNVAMGYESSQKLYVKVFADSSYFASDVSRDYNRHVYELDRTAAKIDGVSIYESQSTSTPTTYGVIKLFGRSGSGEAFKGRMYSVKMYENDVLAVNLVPCYRKSDSVIGMYDTVNDVFYTNSGTGTFSKGADVSGTSYKTLVTDGTDVYSITSGALTASVGLLTNLDAQMFKDYGFNDLSDCVSAASDLYALGEFSILRWCSDDDEVLSTMLVTILATPSAQEIVIPTFTITGSNVTGIELTTTDTDGNPQVAVKFDGGDWEYYDSTDEMWEEVGTGTIGYMTIADLEDLTEEIWAEKFETASTMQTKLTLTGVSDTITLVQYKFLQEEE